MSLSKDTIDRVRESADVVEVISDYISLKKRGQNHTACCPFHNEKTPSFNVSASKGIYKCFGCGASGDAIQFVMDIEGIGYIEAIKQLAKKYGIDTSEYTPSDNEKLIQNEREQLFIILNYAKNYFQKILTEHPEGKSIGQSYFVERGFSGEIIKKFELGYSLDSWDAFLKDATTNQFEISIIEKAGLILKKDQGNESTATSYYDRFRGRVIFPIHNISGKAIGFGARMLRTDKTQPKYINSPETEVYHKSDVLYGMFQAKNSVRNLDNCYLVEGYTDVISMHQVGIDNVVASSGTSLTEGQIKQIKRFTNNITVLYDGDSAGIKASMRGIDMILEADLNVSVVLFPDGEDPDSYSKKVGAELFQSFIKDNAQDFITFKTKILLKDAADNPIKKAGLIKEVVDTITKIPDSIKRAVLLKQCSLLMDIDEQILISEANKAYLAQSKKQTNQSEPQANTIESPIQDYTPQIDTQPITEKLLLEKQEYELIRLLINFGNEKLQGDVMFKEVLFHELADHDFKNQSYQELYDHIRLKAISDDGFIDLSNLLTIDNIGLKKIIIDMITTKYHISQNWERFQIFIAKENDNLPSTLYSSMMRLKWRSIRDMIDINLENLQNPLQDEEVQNFQKIHIQLKNLEREIAQVLGIVIAK